LDQIHRVNLCYPLPYTTLGGLYDDPACQNGLNNLDHTVLAVGYLTTAADGAMYTVVKNSWSSHWGDGGFVYLAQAGNVCGAATQPTYVVL
jgi:C1A family cysteine protease